MSKAVVNVVFDSIISTVLSTLVLRYTSVFLGGFFWCFESGYLFQQAQIGVTEQVKGATKQTSDPNHRWCWVLSEVKRAWDLQPERPKLSTFAKRYAACWSWMKLAGLCSWTQWPYSFWWHCYSPSCVGWKTRCRCCSKPAEKRSMLLASLRYIWVSILLVQSAYSKASASQCLFSIDLLFTHLLHQYSVQQYHRDWMMEPGL